MSASLRSVSACPACGETPLVFPWNGRWIVDCCEKNASGVTERAAVESWNEGVHHALTHCGTCGGCGGDLPNGMALCPECEIDALPMCPEHPDFFALHCPLCADERAACEWCPLFPELDFNAEASL